MNLKLFILNLTFYVIMPYACSQTSRHWCATQNFVIGRFDGNSEIQPHSKAFNGITTKAPSRFNFAAQSAFNGDLMFFCNQYRFFDENGQPLKNSEHIFTTPLSACMQTGDNTWDVLGFYFFDTSLYYNTGPAKEKKTNMNLFCSYNNCFDSLWYFPFGCYKTEIKRDSNNRTYVSEKMQNKYFNIPVKRIQFNDIKRTSDYQYQLLGYRPVDPLTIRQNNTSGIYLFSYRHNELQVLDSFIFNSFDFLPDSIKQRVPKYGAAFELAYTYLSRNRDKIFVNLSLDCSSASPTGYTKELLFVIDVNPATGKFTSAPQLITENISHYINYKLLFTTANIKTYNGWNGYNQIYDPFSLNDSILYIPYLEQKIVLGKTTEITQKIVVWRYRQEPLADAKPIFSTTDYNTENPVLTIRSHNINPYGGLTLIYFNNTQSILENNFRHFADANNPFGCPQSHQKYSVYSSPEMASFLGPVLHSYDYLRVKDTVEYKDCGAYVNIKNISDKSNGLSEFKWYVAKDTKWTQWDSFSAIDLPKQFFTKSGKYLFKLHGTSYKGSGYKEWYIDTINIKIPPKPAADFYAKDSIVCRYTGLQFFNYSHAKDTQKNEYLWSFGDGNTSSIKNPLYVYSKPGIFTVSLFYRNGHCDSTLTKNQYIRVVDAPKPGFSAQYKQGCSPFTANFTDTVTINVKQKDYFFSDNNLWQNISLSNPTFTHVFNKSGVYRAVQRLTGFTGCIIQTDSVIFNISKGLTKSDTLHVFNSSVENKNALVYWNSLEGAVKYQLYKDGTPYLQQKDTFYNEAIPYTKDVIYTIAGIDSCGNQSSSGRMGKPMFLQGNLIGNNEASIIFFSPYQQWKGTDITFNIQKMINGNWLLVNSEKANASYTDNQFLNRSELQACYRIEAYEGSQPSILSHSNELCIPYIPTIFVPTAFSPNDDLINDLFDVTCFGIEKYNLTVYNRWGQEIFRGSDKEAWNGSNSSEGVYLIRIEYTTNLGVKLNQRVNVTLLK